MSIRIANHTRQWVALPGASCDMRVGIDLLDDMGQVVKGLIGRPRLAAMVYDDRTSRPIVELVRRQLTDVGFRVCPVEVEGAAASTMRMLDELATRIGAAGLTCDDLIVAIGDAPLLSLTASIAGSWYGGAALAVIPSTLDAAVESIVTPRGIDVGPSSEALSVRPCARLALCDLEHMDLAAQVEHARAVMVATAVCESERAFATLWDRAESLAGDDVGVLCDQLPDTVKARGQVAASTSPAIRASGAYGRTFARALMQCAPEVGEGVALAEGLRFCARMSAGLGQLSVDDVLAQDELLYRLEVGSARCRVEAEELIEAIRSERFRRTNRLMLELPRMLGRVRLSVVDESLLCEHVQAWCAARQ